MSSPDQQAIWTPPVIATIVYRVVMIIVSIAFIWKKYRRPARQIDEEQLVGVLLPPYNRSHRRTRSANQGVSRKRLKPTPIRTHTPTLREVILDHIEDIVQSALGLDNDNGLTDEPLSFDTSEAEASTDGAEVSSLDTNAGLDIELGDLGLRHRAADNASDTKKKSLRPSSVKDLA